MKTTATDKHDGSKEMHTSKTVTIQDKVEYKDLLVGKEYTVKGTLMDKSTGKPLVVNGKEVKSEATFKPKEANGSITLDFTFDATGLEEKEVVVFENILKDGKEVATHTDINDKDQTVKFVKPSVKTTATDKADGTKELHAIKEVTIQDKVEYTNLVVGKEYTVKGKLMDKATNKPLLVDKKEVTASTKFTPKSKDGFVTLDFKFDAKALDGKEVVVFEDIEHNKNLVVSHADINDVGQTVKFVKPGVKTTASNKADNGKEIHADKTITIQDKVEYTDLVIGKEYTVKGKLMDKATNKPLLVDKKEVTAETKFIAKEKNGFVMLDFTLDASALKGKDVVVFEDVLHKGIEVATHSDIKDKDQTVTFVKPSIKTTATNKEDNGKELHVNKTITIQDKVEYKDLIVGKEYVVKGKLMDKATKKPLLIGDKEVTAETKFTTTEKSGFVTLDFTFDATGLEGKDVVVFEDMIHNDKLIVSHADIEDKGQTVTFVKPSVKTTATNKEDGGKEIHSKESVTIQDVVEFKDLVVGKEYTVKGKLMNKATNEVFVDAEGKEVTAETTFTAKEKSGSVTLDFTFNGVENQGRELVVFEDLLHKGELIATHSDINDKGQTVKFVEPSIKTTATNKADDSKELHVNKEVTIQDKVEFNDLIVGKEYVVKGKLMDKGTNQPLLVDGKEVTSETKFTAKEKSGHVTLDFTLNATDLKGKEVVVFEEMYQDNILVAIHVDINDEGQTVKFVNPEVKTTATNKADGSKELDASKSVTIQDKVEYKDLIIGKEYVVKGKLMDKATNKPLLVNGKEVTAEAKFTAEAKDGSVTLDFTFNATELQGKEVVVFEDLYQDDVLVATHSDINDAGQTVKFKVKPEQPKPEQPKPEQPKPEQPKPEQPKPETKPSKPVPQTGNAGDFGTTMSVLVGLVLASIVGVLFFTRKRKEQ
ncbi:VaFE repeat-containing surface-anchored protein [Bacillus toyonensis]|uniref:VaFE repeat-containing surface-anchored protein n=1 Tax=Bacillus toyonensis TaxID=155322 RepID=UPI0020D279FB|nr:VaFE repeat-containing surface-anchored protein [Bacillus toyonensis]